MSSPRPILKHAESHPSPSTAHRYSRSSLLHSTPPHAVHFPPSPTLTRTFSAYSPSTYDRSPIVVSPNSCALPERGCPGRTYTLDEPASHVPASTRASWKPHNGRHLHPRAVTSGYRDQYTPDLDDEAEDDDESQRTPTHTYPTLPPLIPDLSSESDESDAPTPPPSEPCSYRNPSAYYPPPHSNPISAPSHPPIPYAPYRYSNEGQQAYYAGSPNPLSFLPHPASPSDEGQKARRRKQRDQSRSRDPGASPRRGSDGYYKSLSVCKALANCSLDEPEGGCLGGF